MKDQDLEISDRSDPRRHEYRRDRRMSQVSVGQKQQQRQQQQGHCRDHDAGDSGLGYCNCPSQAMDRRG